MKDDIIVTVYGCQPTNTGTDPQEYVPPKWYPSHNEKPQEPIIIAPDIDAIPVHEEPLRVLRDAIAEQRRIIDKAQAAIGRLEAAIKQLGGTP